MTGILGVELGSDLQAAIAKLDRLGDPEKPATKRYEREGRSIEQKMLWQLKETDYASIYIKANKEGRIEQITAFLRPGREAAFETIGEVAKAPIHNETTVVWDVLRPRRKPMRVVATGHNGKAGVIKLFLVRNSRPWEGEQD
ncbi:MAG TPA: hypothetical protein VJ719_12290 [Chthoniobacterales bacterium]|nr:hypothetical protein [Chthoniobacterales bacterium]